MKRLYRFYRFVNKVTNIPIAEIRLLPVPIIEDILQEEIGKRSVDEEVKIPASAMSNIETRIKKLLEGVKTNT